MKIWHESFEDHIETTSARWNEPQVEGRKSEEMIRKTLFLGISDIPSDIHTLSLSLSHQFREHMALKHVALMYNQLLLYCHLYHKEINRY